MEIYSTFSTNKAHKMFNLVWNYTERAKINSKKVFMQTNER